MSYRGSKAAPESRIPAEQRGRVVGRICLACGSVYPLHRAYHQGKSIHGKDHIAAPCSHEGDAFEPGEDWWDRAVEVLPPPVPATEEAAEQAAG